MPQRPAHQKSVVPLVRGARISNSESRDFEYLSSSERSPQLTITEYRRKSKAATRRSLERDVASSIPAVGYFKKDSIGFVPPWLIAEVFRYTGYRRPADYYLPIRVPQGAHFFVLLYAKSGPIEIVAVSSACPMWRDCRSRQWNTD